MYKRQNPFPAEEWRKIVVHPVLPPLSESQCVHLVELLREVHLLFLVDDVQAGLTHQATDYVQVAADAAVHLIWDHTLIRHIVLDDDEAVGPQGTSASSQELHQVAVCKVA